MNNLNYYTQHVQFLNSSGNPINTRNESNFPSRNAIQIRSRPQTPPTNAFKNKTPLRSNTKGNMAKVHSNSKNLIKLPLSSRREVPLHSSTCQPGYNMSNANHSSYYTNSMNNIEFDNIGQRNVAFKVMVL